MLHWIRTGKALHPAQPFCYNIFINQTIYILHLRSLFLPQKTSDNASIDARIIPTIKDPQIDYAYINQFAKFILPYIQQDYERELSQKETSKKSN